MDRYTAYDDLTFLGFALPASAQPWAQRSSATPRRAGVDLAVPIDDLGDDPCWIMLDGRLFFVAGYTSGGAPYGMFADEMDPFDGPL